MVFRNRPNGIFWREIGLRSLICDEKWANLATLWTGGDYGNSAMSPNTKPLDKSYVGIFSSGSTGQAKCIWNRLEHLKSNAMRSAKAFEVQSEHYLVFMALPWHVADLTWAFIAEELKA
jgi:acyl-coenzyme A synthetase/AMP-(fatty) acid ligase